MLAENRDPQQQFRNGSIDHQHTNAPQDTSATKQFLSPCASLLAPGYFSPSVRHAWDRESRTSP
jgi:hypothetical protein